MNNIKKIKLLYKEAQRQVSKSEKKLYFDDTFENILKPIGINLSGLAGYYYWESTSLIKVLNRFPIKVRRSLFRVCRAVAKRGETISIGDVYNIFRYQGIGLDASKIQYSYPAYYKYFESFTPEQPYGDFRLIPTASEVKWGTENPEKIKIRRFCDSYLGGFQKITLDYNLATGQIHVVVRQNNKGYILKTISEEFFSSWIDKNFPN